MNSRTSVKFDVSYHAVVVLLGSHPSLATRKDATAEVDLACHKCFSTMCLLFGPFGPTSEQKRQLLKNHNFGTAITRI